jgi:rhodanese-related sulfurtransferase
MFEFLQHNILLVVVVVTSGSLLLWPMLRPPGRELSSTDATIKINRENAVVIDVRTPEEFVTGHVPESINIPREKLKERLAEIEKFKDRPIILNCASGVRSGGACGELKRLGFENVFQLSGGMNGWLQAGLPMAKGRK